MNVVYMLCFVMLAAALGVSALHLFRSTNPGDRILALDLVGVIAGAATLVYALQANQPVYIDVVVVLGVIIFFGTVAIARTLAREPNDL